MRALPDDFGGAKRSVIFQQAGVGDQKRRRREGSKQVFIPWRSLTAG
jgi:hypothetical protein